MRLRKLFTAALTVAMVSMVFAMPVSAHGHHSRTTVVTDTDTSCPVCTVEGCTEEGRHTHDGHDYCGYDHKDGYCDYSCETASDDTTSDDSTSGKTASGRKVSRSRCGARRHCHH